MRTVIGALRSGHWPSLAGAWLHFEVSFMAWLLIGALGLSIATEFGLTATQKGLLVAVPLLGGALLRVIVGASSDRFGPKAIGLALLGCECLALVWGWLDASSYLQVLGVGLLLGAAGASFAVALPLASRAYPPAHQGLAMGIAASGNSGSVLAMFFAPRLEQMVGWHGVFGLMVLPVALTALLFNWLVRDDIGVICQEGSSRWWATMAGALQQPSMYWLCFVYAVTFGGFVGLSSFLPIFFHGQYGVSIVAAGSLTAACGLAGSLIRPLGGYMADRLGGLRVLRAVFLGIATVTVVIGQLPELAWAATLMVMAVAVMGFGNGVVFQVVSDRFPKQIGMASGMIGAAGGFGGFLLPFWLGLLKDVTGTYQSGFLLFVMLALVAWLSVVQTIRRSRRADRRFMNTGGFPR
ncbi:MAG: MFS transporter [Nitrospiraceae bacterium]